MHRFSTLRSKGFSLLELVIILAILGILAALLIGGMKIVGDAAKNVRCISNLRQWGLAVNQFAADNNGAFPLADMGSGRTWWHSISPLVSTYILNGQQNSPAFSQYWKGEGINGCKEHDDLLHSYVYNLHLGDPESPRYIGPRARIGRPSQVLMIADAPAKGTVYAVFNASTLNRIGMCHSGHFNGVYLDGHVESRSEVDPQQVFPQQ